MKTTVIVGLLAAAVGAFIGTKLPSGSVGYVVITGTTKDREAAKEYFDKIFREVDSALPFGFLGARPASFLRLASPI